MKTTMNTKPNQQCPSRMVGSGIAGLWLRCAHGIDPANGIVGVKF